GRAGEKNARGGGQSRIRRSRPAPRRDQEAGSFGTERAMKKFQRTTEDFTCTKCGVEVKGDGYTNHCPSCLYSRHVDIHPGDRAENCGGMMAPMGLKQKGGDWVLLHQCEKCGAQRRCK